MITTLFPNSNGDYPNATVNHTSCFMSFKLKVLQFLIGKTPVIANLQFLPPTGEYCLEVKDVCGGLFLNCAFDGNTPIKVKGRK